MRINFSHQVCSLDFFCISGCVKKQNAIKSESKYDCAIYVQFYSLKEAQDSNRKNSQFTVMRQSQTPVYSFWLLVASKIFQSQAQDVFLSNIHVTWLPEFSFGSSQTSGKCLSFAIDLTFLPLSELTCFKCVLTKAVINQIFQPDARFWHE